MADDERLFFFIDYNDHDGYLIASYGFITRLSMNCFSVLSQNEEGWSQRQLIAVNIIRDGLTSVTRSLYRPEVRLRLSLLALLLFFL